MLERKFLHFLKQWKATKKQECLLVKGARQIGKTFIIDYFGKENYQSYVYINFIEMPQAVEIFNGVLTASEIYKRLTLFFPSVTFIEGNTLIFLDEVQMCPNARTALKFLALDDRYDVIASGSLLGINYKEVASIPVGYETQVTMYALDFEEFLWALGYDKERIAILEEYFQKQEKVPDFIHEQMLKLLREFLVIGGMPAVVNKYLATQHFGDVQFEQEKILASYQEDVAKYASNTEKPKVRDCYLSIPRQLAKENTKFQFSVVEKKGTARKFENSIEWLRDANLVHLCYNVSTPTFPLRAYEKEDQYKMYMADTGLLVSMYGYEMKQALIDDTLSGAIKGGIYENLIADMLVKRGHRLNYYRSQNGSVEIEFLFNDASRIVPVEVKANRGSTLSLNKLLEDAAIPYGYKLGSGNVGVNDKKVVLPLYMAMFI